MESWLFQANPKFYKVRAALQHFRANCGSTTWLVKAHRDKIKPGDEVFFWEAGARAGLVGWGEVQTEPERIPLEDDESQFVLVKAKFDGSRLRVRIKVDGECYRSRSALRAIPVLSKWAPISRGVEGTNFHVPPAIREELRSATTS